MESHMKWLSELGKSWQAGENNRSERANK